MCGLVNRSVLNVLPTLPPSSLPWPQHSPVPTWLSTLDKGTRGILVSSKRVNVLQANGLFFFLNPTDRKLGISDGKLNPRRT